VTPGSRKIALACAAAGIAAGRKIRDTIYAMQPGMRGRPCTSVLKPAENVLADARAERVGLQQLEQLSRRMGYRIELILDVSANKTRSIGSARHGPVIWASLDAVDGTIKVAGLGNELPRRFRAANDGIWAASLAFTAPTTKTLPELLIGDFICSAIVDGNPATFMTYPQELIAVPGRAGMQTYDVANGRRRRVYTSSNEDLGHAMVFLDVFQAYDLDTRREDDDRLAVELYRQLTNRHAGGAYDVLRLFSSLSALPRMMLGWRGGRLWYESQGAAFIVINENLPNLLGAVPIVEGAGGICVDFDNRLLRRRKLIDGRTSIVYAANQAVRRSVLRVIRAARNHRIR
jgi:hypothetical protein